MRELDISLNGTELKLAATFKASMEIAEKVADPMMIMREAALEGMFLASNINYDPKFKFTIFNVPLILWIGAKHGGSKLKLEEVQELVFGCGFVQARDLAADYLQLIVGPKPEETVESENKDENAEK